MISRGPSLTEQVRQHLKQLIADDGFEDGRMPPETELAADLGVSRTTIRDALSRLEHEGAIVRRQGAGTFVNEPGLRIRSRLEEMWSYEGMLEAHGFTPSVEVLDARTEPAGDDVAAALHAGPTDLVAVMEKRFFENDDPVVLTINRVPLSIVDGEVDEGDAATPIYEFLERRTGRQLAYYVSDIVPIALTGELADRLRVADGTPAIGFEETGYDATNEPLVQASSYFRDDLLRLRLMRRRAGA